MHGMMDMDNGTRKRGHELGDGGQIKKVRGEEGDEKDDQIFEVRIVCESKNVGGIIGKGGSTINQLRSESNAHVEIAPPIQGASKRIITVRGNVESISTALHLIADKVAENRIKSQRNRNQHDDEITDDQVSVTLVIPNKQIGGIIGKGGAKISKTRNSSGATVKISTECLDESDEKSCRISGTSDQVFKALILICYQLLEECDKPAHMQYWPKPDHHFGMEGGYGGYGPPVQYGGPPGGGYGGPPGGGYGGPPGGGGGYGGGYGGATYGGGGMGGPGGPPGGGPGYGGPPGGGFGPPGGGYGRGGPPGGGYGGPPGGFGGGGGGSDDKVVIPIPEALIGYVIGRGGATINDIRQRSRAQIKISNKDSGGGERTITITGSRQANETAVALVNEKLSQYDVYAQKQSF